MTEFDAHFYENKIFIGGKKEYTLGEILMAYLTKKVDDLDGKLSRSKQYVYSLHYPEESNEAKRCDQFFSEAIAFYSRIDDIIYSLPPYNLKNRGESRLFALLNSESWLWEQECEDDDPKEMPLDFNYHFTTNLPLDELDNADSIDIILKFDEKLKAFAEEYVVFLEDLLRVKTVYEPFLEKIHSKSKFLDNEEIAEVISKFNKATRDTSYSYEKLKPSGSMTITYDVLMPCKAAQKESPVLCESYHFTTIGAFLYIELFKGLQQHYLPKKCGYCGKYFLLDGGLFSDYCTRPVKNTDGKVCRDVGHRKKYADKVKNDPVWTVYVRGYKQHYARLLKKKMTQAEFQRWADYALELRQKAFDEELEFEEYQRLMRN